MVRTWVIALLLIGSVAKAETTSSYTESNDFHFGLGWSTFGVGPGYENAGSSALSMLLQFNANNSLQILFGLETIDPFEFGVGLAYRGRVASKQWAGLHLGALVNVGNWAGSSIALGVGPIMGVSIRPLDNLLFMFDGGPILTINSAGGGTADADLKVGALVDGMLGFSIHYLL